MGYSNYNYNYNRTSHNTNLNNRNIGRSGCGCRTGQSQSRQQLYRPSVSDIGCTHELTCTDNINNNVRRSADECSECNMLMSELQALDFALNEIVLYLDAYPDCTEALDMYHHFIIQRKEILEKYECNCGPVTAMGNMSRCSWDWVKGTLPWEYPED